MKIEFLAFSALVASAAAIPIRIITLTGPHPHLPPSEISHSIHAGSHPVPHVEMIHPPCHGAKKGPSGSLGDLLTRLGFVRPHHGYEHGYGHGNGHEHGYPAVAITHHTDHDDDHHEKNEWKIVKAWKGHVEHVVGRPSREAGEEGFVRILPFTEGDRVAMEESGRHGHGNGNGHLRGYGGHQWVQSSFTGRLHQAISSLTPIEATTLSFVLGAGIGSILHLIFMLFLITLRRVRGLKSRTKKERREARRARRAAKVDKVMKLVVKRLGGGGRVKLEGGEGEVLPAYAEGEGDRLVEKA